MKSRKILCPVDFSPASMHALHMAIEIAKDSQCELVIAHAWHLPALYYSELAFSSDVDQQIVETAEAELAGALRGARATGIDKVSTLLLHGIPADKIIQTLEADPDYDLVVIGANGRSGLARVLMGSVAEKIVRRAPCSVMAVHPTHPIRPFKNILCPIDFSESSFEAFELARRIAHTDAGSVTLLHVLDMPLNYSGDPGTSQLLSDLDKRSSAHLDSLIASDTSTKVTKLTRIGSPGRQILALLESEPPFDLVVVGTHGRTGIKRLVLGSIAEKIVRYAPCPVIVARKR